MTTTATTTSKDGTTISYTSTGADSGPSGAAGNKPGVVIISGNNRMAHNYEKLAANLADNFTVYVIERRGRGQSGPQGENYTLQSEIEDVQAVLAATHSHNVFGHSYGGLIALQAAAQMPDIQKVVAYEPTVSINGSFDLSWLPQFEAAYKSGKTVRATVIFLKLARLSMVSTWPKPLLYILATLLLSGKSGKEMRALMPTTPAEIRETARADSDGSIYHTITANTLLLAGENGAKPIIEILPALKEIIPRAAYQLMPKLNHNSPDLGPVAGIAAAITNHFKQV
ncbi:MAG TPA: alpha/beta hydrolase [Candidatus Saccharimonadales bacterium]|nr:alpha/beta hydrolase [Candidatus Saccharimonadales bacterium]